MRCGAVRCGAVWCREDVAGGKSAAERVKLIYVRGAPPGRPLPRSLGVCRYRATASIFSIDIGRGGREGRREGARGCKRIVDGHGTRHIDHFAVLSGWLGSLHHCREYDGKSGASGRAVDR
ncbi:hypothetical protein E2C01_089415 [Portunus trituberculatus]|uniref:Uncharacterized protein n=1 Tax=Portunus trituberculatus TaxID=210409 RepID=A0A5B7JPI9_PORTR|nr:hypothetical protein [Portunus trituberculatus]